MTDSRIAVLIDFENAGLDSVRWLLDQLAEHGRVIVKRAFADWTDSGKKRDTLLKLGIEPIHIFRSGVSGKNSSDMRLTIDAMDLLHQGTIDTFVIVSGDSDFVPLVTKLRSAGKTVFGSGRRDVTPEPLVNACDRFWYLDGTADTSSTKKQGIPKEETLVVRAVRASADEEGRVPGSTLLSRMQRLDPSFNFKSEKFRSFSKYLEAQKEIRVTRPKGPGDVIVELVDDLSEDKK